MQTKGKNSNKKLAVAALVLLVVLTLAFGGYTLAKYITSASGSGTAQVAKWGYTVDVDATKLFGTKYTFDTFSSKVTDGDASLTVSASSTNNVVAPGTSGTMTIKVSGSSEVKAKLTIAVTGIKEIALVLQKGENEVTYNPIKWTLNDGTANLVTNGTLQAVNDKLQAVILEPNSTDGNKTYTLSWAWAFTGELPTELANKELSADQLDTALGQLAAKDNSVTNVGDYSVVVAGENEPIKTNTGIAFTVNIVVEQLAE